MPGSGKPPSCSSFDGHLVRQRNTVTITDVFVLSIFFSRRGCTILYAQTTKFCRFQKLVMYADISIIENQTTLTVARDLPLCFCEEPPKPTTQSAF